MKNQIILEIKKPCSENFNSFQKTTNGGLCNSCEKEVIDFTKMTSNEIISHFKKNSGATTCGKFNKKQSKILFTEKYPKRKISFISGIGFAFLSLFNFGIFQAQEKPQRKEIKNLQKQIIVEGVVSDESGPLPGVSVHLQGTKKGTETNFDGKFKFPVALKKGDILIFSYLGYKTKKITINDKKNLSNITLSVSFDEDSYILMGAVATKKIYKSKKNRN
ncbi:carboxypeptidase-like regulatory domain-containing protein [Polaribacter aestuariivivens]|uniref:carboxypeptidase-like regulatory domain-containing protein n=1 Tax=Polaribacter aestuariivivens TaxID=2304626 RepID=UPI003F4986F2